MREIKVWTVVVKRADGSEFTLRMTGYSNRTDAMAQAKLRTSNLKGSKIVSCKNTSTEL